MRLGGNWTMEESHLLHTAEVVLSPAEDTGFSEVCMQGGRHAGLCLYKGELLPHNREWIV